MTRLLFIIPVLAVAILSVYFLIPKEPVSIPNLDENEWWGPESLKKKQDITIKPFTIKFDNDAIKDLKYRLKRTRSLAPPLEGIGFEYGFNSQAMDSWLKYWAEQYDFKKREKFLNQFPQFKTNIQGLDIHFIRVTPKVPAGIQTVPVLLLHGWPGSVREFYEAIPLLTAVSKEKDYALEVIIPSLPGYGFSDGAVRPGLGAAQIGVVFKNLMNRLGFKQFYVQGGDWGSAIASTMATLFPKTILGYHTNLAVARTSLGFILEILGAIYPPLIVEPHLVDRMYPLTKKFSFNMEESGYMHLQASKPDTVGVALTDSPSGLLAYILEKFSTATRADHKHKPDGGLAFRFTKDQLIDNLMLYWMPRSITTSMRLYAETMNKKYRSMRIDEIPTSIPTWVVQAKHEIIYHPPLSLKMKYTNIVNITVLDDGGHFLAFEMPQVFANNVITAIGAFRKIKDNVKVEL